MNNTIIIINEIPLLRTTMKITLENKGYDVLAEVNNLEEFEDKYSNMSIDYITVDISEINSESIDILSNMYRLGIFSKVLTISFEGSMVIKEFIFTNENTFLIKPFKEEKLVKVLERL
jgi:DNA-binding NtrC family response regulator